MPTALNPTSNIANKVRNTKLPRTKPLLPLFEVISNAIHSIEDAVHQGLLGSDSAVIKIRIIRNGSEEALSSCKNIDQYPIVGFEITDNGIGFNDDNLRYFVEADTDHKLKIGGKGVGRFVCIKAFKRMRVKSVFENSGKMILREFIFRSTREGFSNFNEVEDTEHKRETTISLIDYYEEYQKKVPKDIVEIAREIATHFQLFFIAKEAPSIIVYNQNKESVNLNNLFEREYVSKTQTKEFNVGTFDFDLILTKSYKAQSHKLIFCAHNRAVKEEGLYNKIIDLGKYSIKDVDDSFYYQAFITGKLLDERVDVERIGFDLDNDNEDEDEEADNDCISLAKIRREAIKTIEISLSEYLETVRQSKMEKYMPVINDRMPQYRNIFRYKEDKVKLLPPNLTIEKLDIELYKIEADWKIEVKEKSVDLLKTTIDITNLDEYKEKYESFLTEFNDVGQTELARYVVHRKAVIELLDQLIGINVEDKFTNEDIIHSIFFPIRSSSDEVPFNKQNLWLLDERLTYHSFLASDKKFESIKEIESQSKNKPDLLIFNDAISFVEEDTAPFNSFTIVEFKKPQRDNYIDNDPKKNPLDQVEMYIEDLLAGNVINRKGRKIEITRNTPFYVYIVCDINDSFRKILEKREFEKTPDGRGYFIFKSKYYSAYIEVIPFEQVLSNAKKRNRILFEKLGINF